MSQPTIKRKVGKYEIGRTIGEGTFAKVKFARNSDTGQPVAIKILDKDKVLKHKMAEQIKREIATMKLIKHPYVVRIHEVLGSKTKIFIVLEFVTGGELFDKIVNNGRMREAEARKYFQQLINAVDYCHSRGVFHRDLKPENLLLDAAGNLKISDFGLSALSRQVRDDGLLHTACGTPNYVAPEVLNDQGYDGATADLWSCGVILFVLLAGYLPFDDSNLAILYKKISSAEFRCPPWISFSAMKLITRILEPNPEKGHFLSLMANDAEEINSESPSEDRVDKYNAEAAEILVNEAQRLPLSDAVPVYEQLLSTFPTSAKYWKQYVEAYMAVNNDEATRQEEAQWMAWRKLLCFEKWASSIFYVQLKLFPLC